ncbi:MAG TPA: energy transducer TonB [Mucilaginibacter sp.]|jgi:hypothetical protein
MKRICIVGIALLMFHLSWAQEQILPEFPGGISAFERYIRKNLRYPEVALLIGINGKLNMCFVISKKGKVTNVTPINCIGAGCEAEAVKLLEKSPSWKPGMLYDRPVSVSYSVPITFLNDKHKASMKELRKSSYGFVFSVKGRLYTIDEAEKILGNTFLSPQIEIAVPFYNYNKIPKFDMPDKKEVYLLIFKSK